MDDKLNIIFLENILINKLLNQTVDLIHSTRAIAAIKKLTQAHDILEISKEVISKYSDKKDFLWDKAAIQDLDQLSKELVIYHRTDFNPIIKVYSFNENVSNLITSLYANDKINHFG
jgi:hypothetical protein